MRHERQASGTNGQTRDGRGARSAVAPLVLAATLLAGCTSSVPAGGTRSPARHGASLEERWGVRVLGLHLSAGGYLLDFRYRVLDAAKAKPILDRRARPYLLDDASGRSLAVPSPPKLGPMRNTGFPVAGRNYFVVFGNPGKFVKRGERVTVVIGDFRAPNLVVE